MSATSIAWVLLAVVLAVSALQRPVWAVALYYQTFFLAPHLWWWGDEIPRLRYSYFSGFLLLLVVARPYLRDASRESRTRLAMLAFLANATFVHFVLAGNTAISFDQYLEIFKFSVLFFLLDRAIRTKDDLTVTLMALTVGAGYIGYEATINERGSFTGNRLEGIGAPAATTANGLASLLLLVTFVTSWLITHKSWWVKGTILFCAPLTLNVVIMCNSRGAFLGLLGGGLTMVLLAPSAVRKQVLKSLAIGSVLLYLLLGDPRIFERFTTTFAGSEERDNSAAGRLVFWEAGLRLLSDYPFGAGGGAFKMVYAPKYLAEAGSDEEARSLHNGYLTTATDWGVQGLAFNLWFIISAIVACVKTVRQRVVGDLLHGNLLGLCLLAGMVGFLLTCMFGSYLTNEWGFWIAAFMLKYSELYAVRATSPVTGAQRTPLQGRPGWLMPAGVR